MARWGSVEYIKEKYLGSNEDYAPLSKDTETYKSIQACFDKVKATVENNRLFGMNGVVDCDKGSHYIIFMSGGANGSGDWREYLKAFNDVLEELEKIGKAWFIELNNDCCDDVHYAMIGFRPVPSAFAVRMTFKDALELVHDASEEKDTVREFTASERDKVVRLVKLFCRNTWPMCDQIVIERIKEEEKEDR